jgi:hypothetical protein
MGSYKLIIAVNRPYHPIADAARNGSRAAAGGLLQVRAVMVEAAPRAPNKENASRDVKNDQADLLILRKAGLGV